MASAEEILNNIAADSRSLVDSEVGDRLVGHASALAAAGASPAKIIDEALLFLLHRGESHAIKHKAGLEDPLGVRPVVRKYSDYPDRLKESLEKVPDYLCNNRKNMQLMTTRHCNLRCGYCPVYKCDRWMDEDLLRRVVDFLLTSNEKDLRLDFSGGEPLFCFDLVLKTCRYGLQRAETAGKNLSFYMVTNGTLLDQAMAKELAKLPMLLEISMDGSEAFHNRFKNPVDGSLNPYRATRRAVDLMLEEGADFYVVMVATPETAPHIGENFDHIISAGVRSVDINYAIGRLWSRESLEVYLGQVADLLRKYGPEISSGRMKVGNIERRVEPSILNAEWMVDTDGSLHLMTEWVFQSSFDYRPDEFSFGNVTAGGDFNAIYVDRFHAYWTLLLSSGWKDPSIRKIIHNNIEVGRRVGKYFSDFKKI